MLRNLVLLLILTSQMVLAQSPNGEGRERQKLTKDWRFHLGDIPGAQQPGYVDTTWRNLNLPHDWSIEGTFSDQHPATFGGGALPGGIGWYRKTFTVENAADEQKVYFIDFDGVYEKSDVWINGHHLGMRPNGYISFRYELTPYLHTDGQANVLAVRVDNSSQPNSRWYSGSGIYRNVWLVTTSEQLVDHWGTFVTTPEVTGKAATVSIKTQLQNKSTDAHQVSVHTTLLDPSGKEVASKNTKMTLEGNSKNEMEMQFEVKNPSLWSDKNPDLYQAKIIISEGTTVKDQYMTSFGIRYFEFDADKGFILNGKPTKILGVCNHHDLGALGAAINVRAMQRQLEILKEMGANGLRTAHNPPAPELLDLCDSMGFIVMDEAFDIWKKEKNPYDYHQQWDQWHRQDLVDLLKRDRNHPSVFIWSIGNEILEQGDSTGTAIARELADIVHTTDPTRPVTAANNQLEGDHNYILDSDALDIIGYNYHHEMYEEVPSKYPGKPFIATETTSALATRGIYDMPSDSIRVWPVRWDIPFEDGNADYTVSAYDNVRTPWGSTHEATWKLVKKMDFVSGMFIWTGFDYLGEPTPYTWPARSSYFGVVDLAGFPKDTYYMYQSEWTQKPMVHLLPHWNWQEGDSVDVWAYSNAAGVELFLNGESLGAKTKKGDELHLSWKVPYQPGTLKAVATFDGQEVTDKVITAGEPYAIRMTADRSNLKKGGEDLAFVTVEILDKNGVVVPHADHFINFDLEGPGKIRATDNGDPISHESFQEPYRRAFNGKCLVIVQTEEVAGTIRLQGRARGLQSDAIELQIK